MERVDISNYKLIKDESEIPGNFTSVRGEYQIPGTDKTGFFKQNVFIDDEYENKDYRELIASKFLKRIGVPCAETFLATKDGNRGSMSINILKPNEEFVDFDPLYKMQRLSNNIDEYIENDLAMAKTGDGITAEDLRKRKEHLIKYVFISAVISNHDIKADNTLMIRNNETGKFRNAEYYDMDIAFLDDKYCKFFGKYSQIDIIQQLYDKYPSIVVPMGKNIEQAFQEHGIDEFLEDEMFDEIEPDFKGKIGHQLKRTVGFIEKLNTKEVYNFKYGIDEIHDRSKEVEISKRDRVTAFITKVKNKIIGRDKSEWRFSVQWCRL